MMDYEKIYFDMDGVLVDFGKGILELCGMELPSPGTNMREYDDRLWSAVRRADRFYFRLDPIDKTLDLFDDVRRIHGDKVEILTAIPNPSRNVIGADPDKREWVRKHIGDDVKVNVVYRRDKRLFAKGKDFILIDDTLNNIDSWIAAGGDGILFYDADSARKELVRRGVLPD